MTVLHSLAQAALPFLDATPAAASLAEKLREMLAEATLEDLAIAARVPVDDELELDEDLFFCDFSPGDAGCWVRAWVWVPADD